MRTITALLAFGMTAAGAAAQADDQTQPGAGNAIATRIAAASPLVQSAIGRDRLALLLLKNAVIRRQTTDALTNPNTCINTAPT